MVQVPGGGKDSKGILNPIPEIAQVRCGCPGAKTARNDKSADAVVAAGAGEFCGSGSCVHGSLLRGYGLRGGESLLGSIIA